MVIEDTGKQGCKVFIGGLSWDTNDTRLRTYFENFGLVKEAFVSYDRETGKPRGFGFVVFDSPTVADRVVQNKHTIDRREVDAKHAMPRSDAVVTKAAPPIHDEFAQSAGSRKIFVGGLPPTVTDAMLRQHFEQIDAVEDAVVMIDHHSKRSRGFGFVTFQDEASVDNVLRHDARPVIHGKAVEIKRAVPREQLQHDGQHRKRAPAYGRGFPPSPMQYPFGLHAPLPLPGGLDVQHGMPRLGMPPQGPYQYHSDPDMAAHYASLLPAHVHVPRPLRDQQWSAQPDRFIDSDASGHEAAPAWQDMGHVQQLPGFPAHVMQDAGNVPAVGLHSHLRNGQPFSPRKSPAVPLPEAKRLSSQDRAPDAFENLASSLGASLPLPGSSFLHT